ncbi:hypothetical protein [Dyella sp. OK004]|uniref:hypothetical protein n=1 Tax=Dyella sp. OK004 TaxID=1855292 RepID=UPI0011602BEC|nr:hypothetical protein [Dyella sp. OK004]
MSPPTHRISPLDVLRHIASHGGAVPAGMDGSAVSAAEARQVAMQRDLGVMVSAIDPEDPASLAKVRLPLLRRIVLAEWGEGALGDQASLAMLRAVDRLVAIDPEKSDLLRRAVAMLKQSA